MLLCYDRIPKDTSLYVNSKHLEHAAPFKHTHAMQKERRQNRNYIILILKKWHNINSLQITSQNVALQRA